MAKDMVNSPQHYTKGIEPIEYIESWNMGFCDGNVIKYVTRAPYKGKQLEDLLKARNYLNRLIKKAEKEHERNIKG